MKILIPILGFSKSGGSRVLSELANNWKEKGHEVDFVVNIASENPYFPTTANIIKIDNFGSLILKIENNLHKSKSIIGLINMYSLYRGIKKIGAHYDIILANHSLTTYPVYLVKNLKAKKFYYIQAYEPEYYELEKKISSKIYRYLSKQSYFLNLIRICNAPIYLKFKEINSQYWVPPGLDYKVFFPKLLTTKNLSSKDKIILGIIGRKEPAKGTIFALTAFEELHKIDKRYILKIAFGNIPVEWSHNAAQIVIPKSDKELAEFYRSLDILIAPGIVQHGAAHYPVMEAMACGIPVVTTGYLPANKNNSWLVEVANRDSIVHAIQEIVEDPNYQLKVDTALNDISQYGWENVAQNILDLFESVDHAN